MLRGTKLGADKKAAIVKRYLDGEIGRNEAARITGVAPSSFVLWVNKYKNNGVLGLMPREKNYEYSSELKFQAVRDYMAGSGSQDTICKKYKIRSRTQLRDWIKVYNSHRNFKTQPGGSRMTKARKTTQEERIQITKECLASGKNHGEIALKYNVSYQQIHTWVKKFIELGEAGLEDRRGKRTAQQEARTPEEELRIRIAQLEHENYMLTMERDLLKKAEEYERRDASHK